ncbi:hypothetical protein PFHG_00048 [Plasmodium falciparum HB3]|uniref:Uncharacterized protein n=1 Tax=Plasmodium falciparum (isolate HB3) TaxID=137071 RepID=A0A0L7K4Y6_PLAFX|nr:hypothetical protein PFHG_00048 [Plasmodium falciparum HB3]
MTENYIQYIPVFEKKPRYAVKF